MNPTEPQYRMVVEVSGEQEVASRVNSHSIETTDYGHVIRFECVDYKFEDGFLKLHFTDYEVGLNTDDIRFYKSERIADD